MSAGVTGWAVGAGTAGLPATGAIAGTITDPEGAVIPGAKVTVTRTGVGTPDGTSGGPVAPVASGQPAGSANGADMVSAFSTVADGLGRFQVSGLVEGVYRVEATAPDGNTAFRPATREGVRVVAGAVTRLTLALAIAEQRQQVQVSAGDLDDSPDKNGGAIVMKGRDLEALSDDPDELQTQLQAIAGTDPETGSQFYVDGFTGGKLPPKSSIRGIRINQNPYSAQYDQLGYGRIEIFTKPGTDKLHGDLWMEGNDSALNSKNPFAATQPGYSSYQFDADWNGPLTKTASFFLSMYRQSAQTESIVNAEVLDSALNQTTFSQVIASPSSNLNLAARLDLQVGKQQTVTMRYQLQRNIQTNGGVGQFALASQAYNSANTEQVLQIGDTQTYGAKVVNETRFQYIRDRNYQYSLTDGPTISVAGAFTGGGGGAGTNRDNQDHYEFQDYLQIAAGKHDWNLGGRLRALRDANYSTANFNGTYTFPSLASYRITEQGIAAGQSATAIRAAGGGASEYAQTQGASKIAVSLVDAGLYVEDNWKVRPNATLSYGLRFESQTDIPDHADFGPRLGLNWAVPGGKNKPPRAVIRGGSGLFFQRFQSGNVLQARRQNGVTQTSLVVNAPDFYPANCVASPAACAGATNAAGTPGIYAIGPTLRAPYIWMSGIGVDKPLGKHGQVSVNYMYSRGERLFLTRNINAPEPGTYNPAVPTSGVRPLGTNENIYEYESEGTSSRNRLVVNANWNFKGGGFYGYAMLGKVESNTSGIGSFPMNGYNLHEDYGRASYDIRGRAFLGGYTRLPGKLSLSPFVIYQSSSPFNITVGQDWNGDTEFNDRPAFATDLTRASVYKTKWGDFDASPIAGQTIIPINYGKGPGLFVMNLRLNKSFQFGPVSPDANIPPAAATAVAKATASSAATAPAATKDGKPAAKSGPPAAAAKPVKKEQERKYTLEIGLATENLLNHVNLAPPVGVLGSPLFGESTALASTFGSGSANRTVSLDLSFRF